MQVDTPAYPSRTVKFSFFVKVPKIVLPERVPSGASAYRRVLAGHFADASPEKQPSFVSCFVSLPRTLVAKIRLLAKYIYKAYWLGIRANDKDTFEWFSCLFLACLNHVTSGRPKSTPKSQRSVSVIVLFVYYTVSATLSYLIIKRAGVALLILANLTVVEGCQVTLSY